MPAIQIPRGNPHLNEAIEMLDMHLYRYSGDIKKASSCLTKPEREFIDTEIEHCVLDPRYYLENYHVVQTEDEGLKTLYPFWDSQEIFYYEIRTMQIAGKPVKIICLKARQQGLCLHPDTRVLSSDLRWIKLSEVKPGQELVAIDEHAPGGRGKARKMRVAKAVATNEVFKPAFRITLDNGVQIVATGEHRFLCNGRGGPQTAWREVSKMWIGDSIRYVTEPWTDSSYEDGWFGGVIDGEGSMRAKNPSGAEIVIHQTPGAVLDRARSYLQQRGYTFRERLDTRNNSGSKLGRRSVGNLTLHRTNEILRLIGQTRPSRFINKRWWEGRDLPGKNSGKAWAHIVSIEALPTQRMIDLQTTEKTFIAEGLVSHNSTISQGLVFQKTIFTETCNTLIVAQDPGQADFLFSMSRLAYDYLPWWMKPEERYQAKGRYLVLDKKDDIERQMYPGLRSQMLVEAANKLTGVARGKTIRAAHFSELASWPDGGILSKAVFPTMNASDELAIMESTAEGRKGFWYDFWRDCEEGNQDWHPVFIEFFRVKKYSRPIAKQMDFAVTKEEEAMRSKVQKKSGYRISDETFNWRRAKIREFIKLEGDEWSFYQEYPSNPMEAFQGSGICAFPKRLLQKILESQCNDPLWYGEIEYKHEGVGPGNKFKTLLTEVKSGIDLPKQESYGGRLYVWEKPVPEYAYYLAVDVAHGVEGGDYSCVQVLKIGHGPEPDEQVAEWHGWINPTPLAHVCAALGYWYNSAQIAVECNDVGVATNNELFRILEYDNIYRWKHVDKIKNFLTDHMGWYTNHKTRDTIISKTREAIMESTLVLRSSKLVDQMMDFSSDDGGKFEGQNTNDDRVMSLLICRYCAHDSDYGKMASSMPRSGRHREETWEIYDPLGRKVAQEKDYDKAFMFIATHSGWSMRPVVEKNRVRWVLVDATGKKVEEVDDFELAKVMALSNKWSMRQSVSQTDFHNTDFSPVHDRQGVKQQLYDSGIPSEAIIGETLMYAQMVSGPGGHEENDGDWKNI